MQNRYVTFMRNDKLSSFLNRRHYADMAGGFRDSGSDRPDADCSGNEPAKRNLLDDESKRLECFVSDLRLRPELRTQALLHMLHINDGDYCLKQWQDAADYLLGGAHGASVAEIKRRIVAYLKDAGIEP